MPDTEPYMKDVAYGSGQHRRNFLFLMYCCAFTTADIVPLRKVIRFTIF